MRVSSKIEVQSILKLLLRRGITRAVLSPGSRNAPFLLSFDAIPEFECISIVDERSAAFVALGMAQQLNQPVVLCCTSGSAMLNYAPAIAEAYYQNIQLIVITADRPAEWIDRGEGQSIRQMEVISGIVSSQVEWVQTETTESNEAKITEALAISKSLSAPVHINVPLTEPLYETTNWSPMIEAVMPDQQEESLNPKFETDFAKANRVLIVVTQRHGLGKFDHHLDKISTDDRVAVLTETSANLYKLGYVCSIDRTLEAFIGKDSEFDFVPDLVITIGENIISKKLKQFIRKHKSAVNAHWHFGLKPMDVFDVSNYLNGGNVVHELARLRISSAPNSKPFASRWKGAFFKAEACHHSFLENTPYTDLKVFEQIMDLVPDTWSMQMGNSSVVRYIQLFNQIKEVKYFGNRGVSGIDGCTSTAVGAALVSDSPVLLISGDHSFRYDANGLSMEELPANLKIIVINNDGGNIFRIIDGPNGHKSSDMFIEHQTHKSIEGLVQYHGAGYSSARDLASLDQELVRLFDGSINACHVLEVFTPRIESPKMLKSYFNFIREHAAIEG